MTRWVLRLLWPLPALWNEGLRLLQWANDPRRYEGDMA